MGIISSASGSSCWRGVEYYKQKRVKDIRQINEFEYEGIVTGTEDYNVHLNLKKPKTSKCNCPFADGRMVICKHMMAMYFTVVPNSAENFETEQNKLQEEYEEYREEQYEKVVRYIHKMKKSELIDELIALLNYAPDWVYDSFVNEHDVE